jgi:YesN/AraC family two-component response regulator
MSVAAFTFTALGRDFLANHDAMIYIGWSVFSFVLFIIGFLGIRQKPINPSFETVEIPNTAEIFDEDSEKMKQLILSNIIKEFEQNKIYLNYQLNIMDLAKIVGSNRTYISNLINQKYNQNFCSFVNNYRLIELESIYQKDPQLSDEVLAKLSGFGSVVSMKRAISLKTGTSMGKWKIKQTVSVS